MIAAGLAGSWLVRGMPQQGGSVAEKIHLPKPEELGRVLPAEPVLPIGPRPEPPVVSGSNHRSSGTSPSGGSMIPSAREVRKLQEKGGVIY